MYQMAHTTRICPEKEVYLECDGVTLDFLFSDSLCSMVLSYLSSPLLLSLCYPLNEGSIQNWKLFQHCHVESEGEPGWSGR